MRNPISRGRRRRCVERPSTPPTRKRLGNETRDAARHSSQTGMNARQTRLDVAGDRPPPPCGKRKEASARREGEEDTGQGRRAPPTLRTQVVGGFRGISQRWTRGGGPSGFILRIAAQVAPGNEWAPSSSLRVSGWFITESRPKDHAGERPRCPRSPPLHSPSS